MAVEDLRQTGGDHISRFGEIRLMEARDRPQAKDSNTELHESSNQEQAAVWSQPEVGDTELHKRSNEEQTAVWSQLELGDTYQRQLDQLRHLAV
jgi:hypothetical protein